MSIRNKSINITLPNATVVVCSPCTCGAGDTIAKAHTLNCALYQDYSNALTEEFVYEADAPTDGEIH